MLNSLFSAFLMYSKIPVPQVEWNEKNKRYALCFFPLIGVIIGALFMLWNRIADILGTGHLLRGAVSFLIPVLVTGGIHLDGFCDVSDAVTSWGDHKKRLEIMKDPHIGAFAAIYLGVCILITAAVYSEVTSAQAAMAVSAGFVLSRALSGLAAVSFKCAKSDGTLQSFVKPSHKKITFASLSLTAVLSTVVMTACAGITGISAAAAAAAVFVYYRISSYRRFGGITGDTEGWFLVLCETFIGAAAVFSEKITEVLCVWN